LLIVTDSIHDSALDYQSDVFLRENPGGAETWLNAAPSAARAAARVRRRAGGGSLFQPAVAIWLPAARFCAARRLDLSLTMTASVAPYRPGHRAAPGLTTTERSNLSSSQRTAKTSKLLHINWYRNSRLVTIWYSYLRQGHPARVRTRGTRLNSLYNLLGHLLTLILATFHFEVIIPFYFMQLAGVLVSAVIPMLHPFL
jgi:hypothetical protein